jgi:hypothetical protein
MPLTWTLPQLLWICEPSQAQKTMSSTVIRSKRWLLWLARPMGCSS